MISVRLDAGLENVLNEISHEIKKSKSAIIREAITQYIEDKLDYMEAVKAEKNCKETVPLKIVLEEFRHEN